MIDKLRGEVTSLKQKLVKSSLEAPIDKSGQFGPGGHNGMRPMSGRPPMVRTSHDGSSISGFPAHIPGALGGAGGIGGVGRAGTPPMTPTAITFAQLRNATVAKFNERVQLQQELIEIEALNAQNHSEIARRQVLCARARAGRRGHEDGADAGGLNAGGDGVDESMVEGVHGPTRIGDVDGLKLGEEVAELQRAVELNLSLKKDVEQRLEENEVESTRIRKVCY